MTRRIPDPPSPFEDEGLPDLDSGLPGKRITGDPQDDMPVPKDEPVAVDDFGTTVAEQREGEPLDLRLAREVPDIGADDDDDDDDDDDGAVEDGTDEWITEEYDSRPGRIVEPDEGGGPDLEPDAVGVDAGADGGGLSAEEQAIHIEPA